MKKKALHMVLLLFIMGIPALLLSGCSGNATFIQISVSPATATVKRLGQLQLQATVTRTSNTAVTWRVQESGGGTVSNTGLYIAPNVEGTYHVIATSVADPKQKATATITVSGEPEVSISIAPTTVTIPRSSTQQFQVTVTGTSNTGVTWSVQEAGGGTVSDTGLYSSPNTDGTYHVVATSVADTTKTATATVTVSGVPNVTIRLDKTTGVTMKGGKLQFTATVTGTTNTGVDWIVDNEVIAEGGSVDDTGLFTAPNFEGNVEIKARSKADPTKEVSARVDVTNNLRAEFTIQGKGTIRIALNTSAAPNTCRNFVDLINKQFYDGIIWHRYEANFVVQCGDPQTKEPGWDIDDPRTGTGGPGYTIPFENNDLRHVKYAVGMARSTERDSAGSQWYICLDRLTSLDGSYVVFGIVSAGTRPVADTIQRGDKITRAIVVK